MKVYLFAVRKAENAAGRLDVAEDNEPRVLRDDNRRRRGVPVLLEV